MKKGDVVAICLCCAYAGMLSVIAWKRADGTFDRAKVLRNLQESGVVSDTTWFPDGVGVVRLQTYADTTFTIQGGPR